jgi:hypothetical protein
MQRKPATRIHRTRRESRAALPRKPLSPGRHPFVAPHDPQRTDRAERVWPTEPVGRSKPDNRPASPVGPSKEPEAAVITRRIVATLLSGLVAVGATAVTLGTGVVAHAGPGTPACPAASIVGSTATVTCNFTGGLQTWTVPAGIVSATFDVFGAQGGAFSVGGGNGGEATATTTVVPGAVMTVVVGGRGPDDRGSGAGGYNGGGGGGTVRRWSIRRSVRRRCADQPDRGCRWRRRRWERWSGWWNRRRPFRHRRRLLGIRSDRRRWCHPGGARRWRGGNIVLRRPRRHRFVGGRWRRWLEPCGHRRRRGRRRLLRWRWRWRRLRWWWRQRLRSRRNHIRHR